jgi:hypothetical protein
MAGFPRISLVEGDLSGDFGLVGNSISTIARKIEPATLLRLDAGVIAAGRHATNLQAPRARRPLGQCQALSPHLLHVLERGIAMTSTAR